MRILVVLIFLTACSPPDTGELRHPGPCEVLAVVDGRTVLVEETSWWRGLPVERTRYGLDGRPAERWRGEYVGQALVAAESIEFDPLPLRTRIRRTLGPDGLWIRQVSVHGDDPARASNHLRQFRQGRLVAETLERNGRVQWERTHRHGSARRVSTTCWFDGGCDAETTTFDERMRPVRMTLDLDQDGHLDRILAWRYRGSHVHTWSEDYDADGEPEMRGERRAAGDGWVEVEDINGDRVTDRWTFLDGAGNIIRRGTRQSEPEYHYGYACF